MNEDQWDREADQLERQLAEGEIDTAEYNEAMRDMQRAYREDAQEAAQDAYDREMDRW